MTNQAGVASTEKVAIREAEIRPNHLIQGLYQHIEADVRWLVERQAGFIRVPCPACGSERPARAFEKNNLAYERCLDCATVYLNPRPMPAILEEFYARSEVYWYWNTYIFPATEEARREKIFRPRAERLVEICQRHQVRTDVLLEVGAGFGTFCEEMRRTGLFRRIIAVEPTPDLAETCRQRGLEVLEKPIEQVQLEAETVDVVAAFEVIEHLFDPRDFLLACARVLSPGGLLVVTCPNIKGFDLVILQTLSASIDHEHFNYFHPASLSSLATTCGLEPLEIMTPGKLDAELVRKKILSGELNVAGQPFLRQLLVDEWERAGGAFQQFLADNLLSSHLWLVARKKGF
ncbi:MAG: class I SAM-dependent methyltransferase [Chloroflexi bacterium]|nr:class I SAM-dependent methyltransferase [Chloroflexota bacterium]